ncbi:MAG: MFS transporter [Gammaproteobacteria bacterium]|nr:MFS transporter [Gammaproteobacteria bacterium]
MTTPQSPTRNPLFWYWSSASAAFGIKNNAFSYLLLPFTTQVLGMPGYVAASALGVAMLWDAVSDLILGHWSDKTSSRLGRRHPFMYAALILLPLSFWGMFNPVMEMTDDLMFWYVLVFAILIRTSTTLVEVPSVAQLPELVSQYEGRSEWLSMRHAFGWLGGNGLHTINFFLWVGHYGMSVHTGYAIYAWVGATLIAIAILISSLGTQKYFAALPRPEKSESDNNLWAVLVHAFRELVQSLANKNFAVLFFNGLLTGIAGGMLAALYLYNTNYFFGFSGTQIAMTGVFVLVSPLISIALIPPIGRIFSKRQIAIFAISCFIFLTPVPYLLFLIGFWPAMGSWLSLFFYSAFIVIEVVCLIINGVMLDSMMADVVEDSEIDTSRRSEGLFYATRGFAAKAFSAGGIFLAGIIVSIVGMESFVTAADMSHDHRVLLTSWFLPIYCGLHLSAIVLLMFYRIQKDTHEQNLATLAERKTVSDVSASVPVAPI